MTTANDFRRSELVALNRKDVKFVPEGAVVTITRSKTDQSAQGRKVGIPFGKNPDTCPVRALRAWLNVNGQIKPSKTEQSAA